MGSKTFVVDETSFQNDVLNSQTPVLVDFWAEWCGPCRAIAPIVDEIATEYEGRLRVAKMDADESPNILMQYGIMGIPTLILFKGGKPVERITGYMPKNKIAPRLETHLK